MRSVRIPNKQSHALRETARYAVWLLFLCVLVQPLSADLVNGRYLPIGDRSAFMANTAVADGSSSMAVLFNPGALGFVERSRIALSGNLYFNSWTNFDPLVRYAGESQNVRLSGFNSVPNSAVSIYKWGSTTLAISVLVPEFSEIGTLQRIGLTSYNAVVQFNNKEQDLWIGATIARVWREKYGVGLSLYGTRYTRRSAIGIVGSVTSGGTSAELTNLTNMEGTAHSVETVLGMFVKPTAGTSVGLKFAPPGMRVNGSGSYYRSERAYVGSTQVITTEDKASLEYFFYRPAELSLGLGVSLMENLKWYFDSNLQFPITFQEMPAVSSPGLYDLKLTARFSSGLEFHFAPQWSMLGGAAIMPSAVPSVEPKYAGKTKATMYVVSLGIIYSDDHVRTGLGTFFLYADGQQQIDGTAGNISNITSIAMGALLTSSYEF